MEGKEMRGNGSIQSERALRCKGWVTFAERRERKKQLTCMSEVSDNESVSQTA